MSSGLRGRSAFGIAFAMKSPDSKNREERLAEALRANLRRRKGVPAKPDTPLPSSPKPVD